MFMGSPDLATTILAKVASQYQVYGVITQPDRPAGRGKQLTPPPVKILAQELGCQLIQPQRLKLPENFEILKNWNPDIILVAAYGQILRQNVLISPIWLYKRSCLFIASLAGSCTIQAAILAGDPVTGVSIMKMDAGIDTGPLFSIRRVDIHETDDAQTLGQKLRRLVEIYYWKLYLLYLMELPV